MVFLVWHFENTPFKSKIVYEATADSGFTICLFTLRYYVHYHFLRVKIRTG